MSWKLVTDEAGRQFYETEATFFPQSGASQAATLTVGPKAPTWLQGMIQSTVEQTKSAIDDALFQNRSAYNIDSLQALRSQLPPRGYTDISAVMDDEDYDEIVNMQGDVVRREPRQPDPELLSPLDKLSRQQRQIADAVNTILGAAPRVGAPVAERNTDPLIDNRPRTLPNGRMDSMSRTISGFGMVASDAIPQGMFLAVRPPGSLLPTWDTTPVEPEPEPETGRFQNLDWE